jgi:hypothetical protein
MAKFVKLNVSNKALDDLFADLPDVTKRATVNTVNKVTRKANKNIKEFVTDIYNIPKRSIKLGGIVSIKRADARKNLATATIFIRRVGRGLFKYAARRTESGVTVKIKNTRKRVKGGFVSSWYKGGIQQPQFVFRKGRGENAGTITRISKKGTPYKADKREALSGPMIADLYTSRNARKVLDKTIEKEFQPTLDEEFNRQVDRKRR